MHNSSSTGSTKWPQGWGNSAGSKYGKFTCNTCHTAGLQAGNAKQIRTSISTMDGNPWVSTGTVTINNVTFNSWSTFGSPFGHTSSLRICEVCHSQTTHHRYNDQIAPTATSHYDDTDVTKTDKDCMTSGCHSHTNGFKAPGGCTTCHGNPPISIATLATPATYALRSTAGAHAKHVTTQLMQCATCHKGNTTSPMGNTKIELGFQVDATNWKPAFSGTVTFGTFTGRAILGSGYSFAAVPTGAPQAAIGTKAGASAVCSVYCHGNWPGSGGTKPDWGTDVGNVVCGKCHGASAATPPQRGSHPKHAGNGTYTGYSFSCTNCHSSVVSGNTTHINGAVQWRLSTGKAVIGASAQYKGVTGNGTTGVLAGTDAYGSCTTVYCHSNGRSGTNQAYNTPTWGVGGIANCIRCHGNSNATQRPMSSNAHRAHINNTSPRFNGMSFNCEECHAATLSATFINNTSIATRSNHVNGVKDVVWGAINSAPVTGTTAYTPGSTCASTSQSQIYCHSNGTSTTVGTVQTAPNQAPVGAGGWTTVTDGQQGTKDCGMCHGGAVGDSFVISTNRHTQHVTANSGITHTALTCNFCHGRTVNATGTALITNGTGLHLSRTIDVRMSTKSGAFGNRSGAFSFGTAQCTNTYCHGNTTTPAFTQTASALACTGCHEATNAVFGLSSTHLKHYNTPSPNYPTNATGWTSTKNSGTYPTYVFMCGNCHNASTTHVSGPPVSGQGDADLSFNLTWAPSWTNTVVNRAGTLSTDARGFKYSRATSCNVYCHSNGYTGNPKSRTQALQPGTVTCGKCHATSVLKTYSGSTTNIDWSPGHKKHMMAAVNGGGAVTQNRYSSNSRFRCGTCHVGTVANGTNILLAGKTNHLNGFVNVTSQDWAGKGQGSGVPLKWNSGTYTCTNAYCHSNGRVSNGVQYNTTPSWRGGTVANCLACHGGRDPITTNYAASAATFKLSTTHQRHLGKYTASQISCQMCHGKTATNAVTLKQYTGILYHVNGTKNATVSLVANIVVYGSYTSYKSATKKCSNVSCHGGITKTAWIEGGSALSPDYVCVKCHGVTGTANGSNIKLFAPGWNKQGTDTDQKTSRAAIKTGAHFLHLSSVFMRKLYCNECHNNLPTSPFDAGHSNIQRYGLNTGVLNFANSTTALYNGAAQGSTPTRITGFSGFTTAQSPTKAATCSSVYCHGNRLHSGNTEGTLRKPYWNYSGAIVPPPPGTLVPAATCSKCHGLPPSNVSSHNGLSSANFPGSCNCHSQIISLSTGAIINKALHINGVANNSSVCTDCHGVAVTSDNIYNPRAVVPDFSLASRHVFSNTGTTGARPISAFDCVVCHMEGDESKSDTSNATPAASPNATYHRVGTSTNSRFVHLRNVQTVTGQFLWSRYSTAVIGGETGSQALGQTQKYSNMDSFCMTCHSPKGATGIISYAATNGQPPSGTRATTQASGGPTTAQALNPWSEDTTLTRASGPSSHQTRTRITNIFSQFSTMWKWPKGDGTKPTGFTASNYAGNASHHAVRGPRYYGNNSNWGTAAWSSKNLKSRQNINSVRETAQLHCADCHTCDTNGHGSNTVFALATSVRTIAANGTVTSAKPTGYVVGFSGDVSPIDMTCWTCHSGNVYSSSAAAGSRWAHTADGHADAYNTGSINSYVANSSCRNCHGGGSGNDVDGTVSTQYGGIHGLNGTVSAGTSTRYRFVGGAYMSPQPATGDAGWSTTGTQSCYFAGTGWSTCTHHTSSNNGGGSYTYSYGRNTTY